jgi:DNA-binding MarR family transcriptional regulator
VLSPTAYRELAQFRFEIRRFLQFSENAARQYGLEPQQHQALLILKGLPEGTQPTIGELAARLFVKHHSAVGLVDRLEQAGLVTRKPSASDARQVLVILTRTGESVIRKLTVVHREELQESGPHLLQSLETILVGRLSEVHPA